jgi:hypothetical protein
MTRRAANQEDVVSKRSRPKWAIEAAVSAAVSLHEEALLHATELSPRIDAGLLAGLLTDADALRSDAAVVATRRADRKSATLSQDAALRIGYELIVGVRTAVRRAYPDDKALQREFGVGEKLDADAVGSVASGLHTVINAIAANPERARSAGLLPADQTQAQGALDALTAADHDQDRRSVSAKDATARRVATQLRLEASIGKLLAAAAIAFCDRPAVLARFEALIPSRPHRNGKQPIAAPQPA